MPRGLQGEKRPPATPAQPPRPASLFLDRSLLENSSLAASAIRAAERGKTMKRSKFTEAQIAFILRQAEQRWARSAVRPESARPPTTIGERNTVGSCRQR